jgi:hypothetical protein
MPAPLLRSCGVRFPRVPRPTALIPIALAAALACSENQTPTEPSFAKGGAAVPLTVNPTTFDFASLSASSQTLTVKVQYLSLITASSSSCATVSPQSRPATKPPGSSVYVATFTFTPAAVGQCTVTVTDKKGNKVSVPVNVGAAGEMYFVAHEDDDILFMNPDILHAIAAGKYVTVVYLTGGACSDNLAFAVVREAGVMAAYARLAGVADEWTLTDQPVRELTLDAQPKVALVFFRLSASASEAGNVCPSSTTNLRGLWLNGSTSPTLAMTSLDGANTYTRAQLVTALANLLRRLHPVRIGTLDATGLFGSGDDPSGLQLVYPALGGRCYFYDHSDHFYSGRFTGEARDLLAAPPTLGMYRGYNQANQDPSNVASEDFSAKQGAFEAYSEHDFSVQLDQVAGPPYGGLYDAWLERQYDPSTTPASETELCSVLTLAQQPSAIVTSEVPFAQQPIVQLQDAITGTNVATPDVEVTALVLGGGTLLGTATVKTDANGTATFTNLAIKGDPGQYTLDFVATGSTELTFDVTVAGP